MARLLRQRATIAEQASQTELDLKANLASPALTGTPTGIVRGSLAADIIDGTKLADDAVESEHYADSSIDSDHIAASVIGVKPHIIPDVLYPSSGNDLAGDALVATTDGPNSSTVASSKYGTVQASDGRMYYYTDIKGSKPIKDPRIGAHFGSQRHKFKSLQLLEQETATEGKDIFSVDGREWIRAYSTGGGWDVPNDLDGNFIRASSDCTGCYLELTGYFNDINFILHGSSNRCDDIDVSVNGTLSVDGSTTLAGDLGSIATPLGGRFVDGGGVINGGSTLSASLGTTPAINTVKYEMKTGSGEYVLIYGIELIAQDTSNVNNIQIPSQNVVSYGKKFTVAETPHYNPFAFAGDGTTAVAIGDTTSHGKVADGWTGATLAYFDSTLDTATSLGLTAWETATDFYRPVNGGRIVKWVDSTGAIKTSVNMMPPCATAITAGSDASLPTSHSWTTVYQPKIKSGAVDHSQAEVAKTFHWREFGNGNANGGTHATTPVAPYADASMLNTRDDIAYVMDDGLTSLSGVDVKLNGTEVIGNDDSGDGFYFTFIGSGITIKNSSAGNSPDTDNLAQNLPYGTHVVKYFRTTSSSSPTLIVDGITITASTASYSRWDEITFHQPKMPPIPEDAVVLADYMLMADFVPITTADNANKLPSKGCRRVNSSRDFFYEDDGSNGLAIQHGHAETTAFTVNANAVGAGETVYGQIPSFCTNFVSLAFQNQSRHNIYLDTVNKPHGSGATQDNTASWGSYGHLTTDTTLGLHTLRFEDNTGYWNMGDLDIASPIHTSSHYQTFETPFLHELVGGDRNMEQTNLVVTPDGKSWDQVTRDVSYLGSTVVSLASSSTDNAAGTMVILDEARGESNNMARYWKDSWVLAYDRIICLKDGEYRIECPIISAADDYSQLLINGNQVLRSVENTSGGRTTTTLTVSHSFKRGDYVQEGGGYWENQLYSHFRIYKL